MSRPRTLAVIVKKPKLPVIRNIVIEQLQPSQLHAQWAWLKRGALDILSKVQDHTEWIPEDLYGALRYPAASNCWCFICSRNQKALGWVAVELQAAKYDRRECFIWCGWTIPLAERTPLDDVDGGREQLMEYLKIWARSQGCDRISCLSPRHLEYLGWTKGHTIFYIPV